MADKRYYWMKIDSRRFEAGNDLAYLMGQRYGAVYVVMYQMLCLSSKESGGELAFHVMGRVIPYTDDDIVRELRYFTKKQVQEGMRLFKALGMVEDGPGGVALIANFKDVVGSKTDAADRMRLSRERRNNVTNNVQECSPNVTETGVRARTDTRRVVEEEKEERGEKGGSPPKIINIINPSSPERETQSEKEKEGGERAPETADKPQQVVLSGESITPPTRDDCDRYFRGTLNLVAPMASPSLEAEAFFDHYAARGWELPGGVICRDWRALARGWVKNGRRFRERDGVTVRSDRDTSSPYARDTGVEVAL